MANIYLLKDYKDNRAGDIIFCKTNIAAGLIHAGIGRFAETKDNTKKTELGETKTFESAPNKPHKNRKNFRY